MAKSSAENDPGVQGMANQTGVKNDVLLQKFKQARQRPRARQREGTSHTGTGIHVNWAARRLEFLRKYIVFTYSNCG